MALNTRNAQAEELATAVARLAGETKTQGRRLADELDEIALHCSRLPVLDARHAFRSFGMGRHRANLNYGDFTLTDVTPALPAAAP